MVRLASVLLWWVSVTDFLIRKMHVRLFTGFWRTSVIASFGRTVCHGSRRLLECVDNSFLIVDQGANKEKWALLDLILTNKAELWMGKLEQ